MKPIQKITMAACVAGIFTGVTNAYGAACGTVFPNENCTAWTFDASGNACTCNTCNTGYCKESKSATKVYGGVTYYLYNTCGIKCSGSGSEDGEKCDAVSNPCHDFNVTIGGQLYCKTDISCQVAGSTAAVYVSNRCSNYKGISANAQMKCVVIGACKTGMVLTSDRTKCICAKGYYGAGGASGCTKCPALDGIDATTDTDGATAVSSCCISDTSQLEDDTGRYMFDGAACCYK